jgi:hypothetical protein
MFPGKDVPDATDILVPRWWSKRFYKGTFSNCPVGVNRYAYDLLRVWSQHDSILNFKLIRFIALSFKIF